MLAKVVSLSCSDDPANWRRAGFTVDGSVCGLGDVEVVLGDDPGGPEASGEGIVGWTIFHPDEPAGQRRLDGLTTTVVDSLPDQTVSAGAEPHPNGATTLDHLVVASPDIERTTEAFASVGVEARRTRDTTAGEAPLRQRFFRMGTIIELIGPPEADPSGGPARFWGLAIVVPDLASTATVLGDRLGSVKDAVQPGRQIATLRTRELGIAVPIAFMSPHPRAR